MTGIAAGSDARLLGIPRWSGERGRLEVWYATFTDTDGTGYWIHYELVAPTTSSGVGPFGHGWAAVFPTDAAPTLGRFRDDTVSVGADCWFDAGGARIGPGRLAGSAGEFSWDLAFTDQSSPLFTFPKAVWDRELLPGAQIVPWPTARFSGTVKTADRKVSIEAQGALSRIYGRGNPFRWCWVHAQLAPNSVLEAVCAVAHNRGLRRLPPATMMRLRLPGYAEWPPNVSAGALRLRTHVNPTGFTIRGSVAGSHLTAEIHLPPQRCITVPYLDPDGSSATCVNSERADVEVTFAQHSGAVRHWRLEGCGHAEIGTRP